MCEKALENEELNKHNNSFVVLNHQTQGEAEIVGVGVANKKYQGEEMGSRADSSQGHDYMPEHILNIEDKEEGEMIEGSNNEGRVVSVKSPHSNAGAKTQVMVETMREEKEEEGSYQKQVQIVENFIPLQIMDPKKSEGDVEEKYNNNEVAVICPKSQPAQTLHEMVSHQGVEELLNKGIMVNGEIEDRDDTEILQIQNRVFIEAGISITSATKHKGKDKGEVMPTRSNPRRGTRIGSK
ncbi:hypothetical protein KY285_010817 [Solanum tuberosum]|nr:hypothetical protein KY289_011388 [Solanum tuberosum]KAH0735110.1 hypothetical protein KY285_010817 [Solanum tuberosum]